LQQQVQQATPPTPKEAEETVSALAKSPVFSRSNPLLMFSPQKKDGGKQTHLNASPPKQPKINEATSNKPDTSGEMLVFPPRSPQSTSTPKPMPEQTSCIDLSLHPKQGGSSVQPRTTTTSPILPASNSLALNNSSKLRQQPQQLQVQQPVLPPSTCQQPPANTLAFPSYTFLQQLAAVLSMPDAVSILAPVNAGQLQANQALSEAQRQGRRRILFTPYQIGELLKCYKKKNYITPAEREQLGRRINLTAAQTATSV
uniref:Homeobox domain-containing protein n=1 Tax=Taenia asiatica TaxID=60517 RepID=A0A0R3WHC6_TAEAS